MRISPRCENLSTSPGYPQSSGKAENAVKVCKALSNKARADNKDPLQSLLNWGNTPSEGLGTSPVQRLMGRRTRTLLPTSPQTAGAKSREPDRRQVGKAQSHTRAAVRLEESTVNTATSRSSDQYETP